MVVVAYGLDTAAGAAGPATTGCLNIHASLLPRWRAARRHTARHTGRRQHRDLDHRWMRGLDTGDVLLEAPLPISAHVVAGELRPACGTGRGCKDSRRCTVWPAGSWCRDRRLLLALTHAANFPGTKRALTGTPAPSTSTARYARSIRGPLPEMRLRGEPVKLLRSRVAPVGADTAGAIPGTARLVNDALEVSCGQGVLQVLQLQRAGRRRRRAISSMPNSTRTHRSWHSNERQCATRTGTRFNGTGAGRLRVVPRGRCRQHGELALARADVPLQEPRGARHTPRHAALVPATGACR
jgi:methionyl-tRNA formyltransferase